MKKALLLFAWSAFLAGAGGSCSDRGAVLVAVGLDAVDVLVPHRGYAFDAAHVECSDHVRTCGDGMHGHAELAGEVLCG